MSSTRGKVVMPSDVKETNVEVIEVEDNIPVTEYTEDEPLPEEPVRMVEDIDPEEILWPDGPTAGDIVAWKEEFDDVYVTSLTLDEHYVWRTLDRSDYRAITKHLEQFVAANGNSSQSDVNLENEEIITEIALLYPKLTRKDFKGKKAGLPTTLSQFIWSASGFEPVDTRLL